ncbi:MAG: hypothetical protein ACOY4O_13000 [Pseudomonadota bacterium]
MTSDNKAAAEDYRRQRQEAEAKKNGIDPVDPALHEQWVANNRALLEQAARAGGASEAEIPEYIDYYLNALKDIPSGSPYDDPHALHIINRIVNEVERICRKHNLPVGDGVVFGVTPTFELHASQMPVLETEASILGLSIPFFVFCNAITKAMAKTLTYIPVGASLQIDNSVASAEQKLRLNPDVVELWVEIFSEFGANRFPPALSPIISRWQDEAIARKQMMDAVELFAIAHEYGHHSLNHGRVTDSSASSTAFSDEHDADVFGRVICILHNAELPVTNPYLLSGTGAVLILGAMDLVRKANALLETGQDIAKPRKRHPPYIERIKHISAADNIATTNQIELQELRVRRNAFVDIWELIWSHVRPKIEQMHKDGIRPKDNKADFGGWLPLSLDESGASG